MRARPYGEAAVLLELADSDAVARLAAAPPDGWPDGVEEIVPAARTVLVRFDPRRVTPTQLQRAAQAMDLAAVSDPRLEADPVVIPVVYDGVDLHDVARLAGLSVEAVIQRHAAARYRCGFCGFAPGFSYLTGGDPALHVPRLDEPRARVPAGSVAIAGEFSAVYPQASPGGWRLLGRTDARMWDLGRPSPALAPPGAAVRFEAVRAGA